MVLGNAFRLQCGHSCWQSDHYRQEKGGSPSHGSGLVMLVSSLVHCGADFFCEEKNFIFSGDVLAPFPALVSEKEK